MPLPRRDFLRSTATFAAVLPLTQLSGRAADSPKPTASGKPAGLFFDAADVPRIRKNLEHPRLATVREKMRNVDYAERLNFIRNESSLRNRVRHMAEIRQSLEYAALAFLVWEDPRDLELATAALQRILQYDPWDYFLEADSEPIGFQRAPEATIAVVCALDWIGDHLDPALIVEAEHQVATKGAPACYLSLYGLMYPDRVQGWSFNQRDDDLEVELDMSRWPLILNSTNLKIIPTCALGMAAIWLHGRHPQANNWLQMSRRSAQAFGPMYGLDGSYDEGVGYWGYTTLHLAMLAEVLYRRLGIDERDLINYPGSTEFAIAMSMPRLGTAYNTPNEQAEYNFVPKGTLDPANDIVNFGDSGHGIDTTVASWIGQNHDHPLSNFAAAEMGAIKHLPGAFWFDPDAPTTPPGDDLLNKRLDNDWVISRSDWTPASTVVALRSGGPANHEHADRNSIIFKAHGERLFHDPYKSAYSPINPRWLLRLTEAHTAVLIDGEGHQYHDGSEGTNASWATATVTGYQADAGSMQVTSDATSAYRLVNEQVKRVDRSLLYLKPDVLLILDRLTMADDNPATFAARYQVFNEDALGEAAVDGTGFTITRPFASLRGTAHVHGDSPAVTLEYLDLPAEEGSFPYVATTSPSAAAHHLLTVVTAAPTGEAIGDLNVTVTEFGWTVQGSHRGLDVDINIDVSRATLPFV